MFWIKKKGNVGKKEVAVAAPKVSTRKGLRARLRGDDEWDPSQEHIDYVDYLLSIVDKDIAEAHGKLYYGQIVPLNLILTQISLKLGDFCAAMGKANNKVDGSDDHKKCSADGDDK